MLTCFPAHVRFTSTSGKKSRRDFVISVSRTRRGNEEALVYSLPCYEAPFFAGRVSTTDLKEKTMNYLVLRYPTVTLEDLMGHYAVPLAQTVCRIFFGLEERGGEDVTEKMRDEVLERFLRSPGLYPSFEARRQNGGIKVIYLKDHVLQSGDVTSDLLQETIELFSQWQVELSVNTLHWPKKNEEGDAPIVLQEGHYYLTKGGNVVGMPEYVEETDAGGGGYAMGYGKGKRTSIWEGNGTVYGAPGDHEDVIVKDLGSINDVMEIVKEALAGKE